jgi:2-polyprenyl-6-methoxyphenol hydroxylase-like FAD-dependent oxidoreductase
MIFEAEESLDFRSQGGTLDLNSGLEAIKAASLYDEYLEYSRFDGSALGLYDKDAKFHMRIPASKYGNPEIDRVELRALLLRSLPDGMVRWKHRLLRVEDKILHFEEGTETGFDLIAGADGAWSRVRNALTEEKPFFSGVAGYNLSIPNAAETAPAVSKS